MGTRTASELVPRRRRRAEALSLLVAVLALLSTAVAPVGAGAMTVPQDGDARIAGAVVDAGGAAVEGVKIDLFERVGPGMRGDYIGNTFTGPDGSYNFTVAGPSCHIVVFTAPDGRDFGGSRFRSRTACVADGGEVDVSTTLGSFGTERPQLNLVVSGADGTPAAGARVVLSTVADSGDGVGRRLISTTANDAGESSLSIWPGCFILELVEAIPPALDRGELTKWICVESGEVSTVNLRLAQPDPIVIAGLVTFDAGDPAPGVKIDLFRSIDGRRGSFRGSTTTGDDGSYRFPVDSGCYILTFIAPPGFLFGASGWYQPEVCVFSSPGQSDINAVLSADQTAVAVINASVVDESGPVEGVKITLWSTLADGRRGAFLDRFFTAPDGFISEPLTPACYWFIFVAPDGQTFAGSRFQEEFRCLAANEVAELRAVLTF